LPESEKGTDCSGGGAPRDRHLTGHRFGLGCPRSAKEVPMKVLASLAFALLFALGATAAYAGCQEQHACADGYTWSSVAGTCIPKSVTS
jgi:hypothetical protein